MATARKPAADKPVPDKPSADTSSAAPAYRAPEGVETEISWGRGAGGERGARSRAGRVVVNADWLLVREHGVPTAEVFFTSYRAEPRKASRPVTFLFNGGPGAASAFLHVGTAGPRRVAFGPTGRVLAPPARLVDNAESWLRFSDLVFVDPVGTGFSRTVAESKLERQGADAEREQLEKRTREVPEASRSFHKVKRDIEVLAEFVSQWLSRFGRWESPVSIAGESYGGFRVGKLMRALPERGVALTGAVMISPAIDILALCGDDYAVRPWLNTLPTMALSAAHHGRSGGRYRGRSAGEVREAAEAFAEERLATLLLRGDRASGAERGKTLRELADLVGLPLELVERHGGRVPIRVFARELLRDRGELCGLYDASVTGPNVFPDREGAPNPDPTLAGIMGAYSAGVNTLLRGELGLRTEREYLLLGESVYLNWADDRMEHYWSRTLDCADDMRYGIAGTPSMRLLVCHGWYDLVTTYFSSERSVGQLRLPGGLRERVTLKNYDGGHMFYAWDRSRRSLVKDVSAVVTGK